MSMYNISSKIPCSGAQCNTSKNWLVLQSKYFVQYHECAAPMAKAYFMCAPPGFHRDSQEHACLCMYHKWMLELAYKHEPSNVYIVMQIIRQLNFQC